MKTPRTALRAVLAALAAALVIEAGLAPAQPPPAAQAAPPSLPPLFFKEEWRQRARPSDAPADFVLEGGVTSAAVTNAALELRLYDPNAASVAAYRDKPPARSNPRDWGGASCVQLAGYNLVEATARATPTSRDSRGSAGSRAPRASMSCVPS